MAMVIVILLNVLIAQLSYTYSEAKTNAKLQYAIDRIVIVTRIEYSRFSRFVSVSVETIKQLVCFQILPYCLLVHRKRDKKSVISLFSSQQRFP